MGECRTIFAVLSSLILNLIVDPTPRRSLWELPGSGPYPGRTGHP